MNNDHLWAKGRRDDEPEVPSMRLSGHLADVVEAARRVVDETGDAQLSALGLPLDTYRDRLRRCVLLAAALHDLGKANDHFQGMVRGTRQNPQGLRHEWVTILMMRDLRTWLLPAVSGSELDLAIVEWAIAGHHPAHKRESPPKQNPDGSGPEVRLQAGHPEMAAILDALGKEFHLSNPPKLVDSTLRLTGVDSVFNEITRWELSAKKLWKKRCLGRPEARFVAAVKASLIAADGAGSALPRVEPDEPSRWDWISRSFANLPGPDDLRRVAEQRLQGSRPREFQCQVRDSCLPVTYVKAGCGTGKTVAAYLWAARNHPSRRLYFCYPTTGTATEGFKDYLLDLNDERGDGIARLFHSRRDVDFEIILNTGADSLTSDLDTDILRDALEAWSTPIAACTVDTVLGLTQNHRRGLFAWPALAQSAFVFDEVHAYDDRLFGALLQFLQNLPGLPCLLMTASLPKHREEALARALREVHGVVLEPIHGPAELEDLPRYHKEIEAQGDPLDRIQRELESRGKVLWVCNTVGRVVEAAKAASHLGPIVYHSRFRYEDRVRQHADVVAAFSKDRPGPALAICSQVAEMSLDLQGCTLLVTDLAPVPALIQRLGRLNRQANKKDDPTRPFIVVTPDSALPYEPADLEAACTWLKALPAAEISQQLLVELWKQSDERPPNRGRSNWLEGGPITEVGELRKTSPGITVLMKDDEPAVIANRKALARVTIPMTMGGIPKNWPTWKRRNGFLVAPRGVIQYDPKLGASWNKSPDGITDVGLGRGLG